MVMEMEVSLGKSTKGASGDSMFDADLLTNGNVFFSCKQLMMICHMSG